MEGGLSPKRYYLFFITLYFFKNMYQQDVFSWCIQGRLKLLDVMQP